MLKYVVGLLTVFGSSRAAATGTEASTLRCEGDETTPNEAITCRIQLLDELQEPTIAASESDFSVHVNSDVPEATVTVTSLERARGDATILLFHVSSDVGCHLRVDVVLSSNRRFIRKSGTNLLVLASPPTSIGPLVCGDENFRGGLTLRESVECSAEVTGAHNIPALVRPTDVLLSEDHSDGTIHFLDGRKNLKISFTAPIKPSLVYAEFVLRVSLAGARATGAKKTTSLSLPIIYPELAPTDRTTLSCTKVDHNDQTYCNVEAFDDLGPIQFNSAHFEVSFEWQPSLEIKQRLGMAKGDDLGEVHMLSSEIEEETERRQEAEGDDQNGWVPAAIDGKSLFKYTWVADDSRVASSARLDFERVSNDFVFPFRVHLRAKESAEEAVEVTNSPYVGSSGVPPTPVSVSVYVCDRRFMSVGQLTSCTVRVDGGTSADPTFITATATAGEIGLPQVRHDVEETNETGDFQRYNPLPIQFSYMAPEELEERQVTEISVSVEKIVVGSIRVVVYPRSRRSEGAAEKMILEAEEQRQNIILLGFLFFGAGCAWGFIVFVMRLRRISHVRAMRRQVEENEMQADLAQRRDARRRSVKPDAEKEMATGSSAAAAVATADNDAPIGRSHTEEMPGAVSPRRVDFTLEEKAGQ